MAEISVSILIPNQNGVEILSRCLAALYAQTFKDFEIIVVDNGSTDGSCDFLRDHYPDVTLVQLNENLGFAGANNLGARVAKGKWLALLNNDAFPEPAWLESLMTAEKEHTGYTFFASKLIQTQHPTRLDGAGDIYHISGVAWRRYYNFPLDHVEDIPVEVFSPCAAAALYLKDAYLQVGGMDEDFISYHEDVDLGFRLRLKGHRCLFVPDAIVHHIGSATYGHKSDVQVYYGHRNLVWSYFQNMPGWLVWWYLPSHIIVNIIFLLVYTFRGQASAIWRAKFDAVRGLPLAIRKRRQVQRKRKISPSEIKKVMSHRWLMPYILDFKARKGG